MAVLVFRHGPSDSLGRIEEAFDTHSVEWRYVDLWKTPEESLAVEQASALVSMGGPMSVNDPFPWLRREERYLVNAISSGVPVLGVCLGAQLLAACLGSRVYRMDRKEIGWHTVRLTDAGSGDPLFAGWQQEEVAFHWHEDMFDLPAGADRLAGSELCPNQAFRFGSCLYGVQFHPEVSPEIIGGWCREDESCGELREADEPIDPLAHEARTREIASHLFGQWCDLIATR